MSGRWIKRKRARSEWGRTLAKLRWAKHHAEVDEKIKNGEIKPPEPEWPLDRPLFEISVRNCRNGSLHEFQLYRSRIGRRDQYRIVQDGKQWKSAMGLTRFLRGLGAAMFGAIGEKFADGH